MLLELFPGDDLDHLVQGAETAGQDDETVGLGEHGGLALVHGAHHPEFVDTGIADLVSLQEVRDHAGDVAALFQDGPGDHAHEADVAGPVDHPDAAPGDVPAQRAAGVRMGRVGAQARAAEDAKGTDACHGRSRSPLDSGACI